MGRGRVGLFRVSVGVLGVILYLKAVFKVQVCTDLNMEFKKDTFCYIGY